MGSILFPTSLIAAFVAGMVALFAPCCISFLLPAYLGSVFKEKGKILFMTLVFAAGIFVVLLPAVVGVSIISQLLFRYHNLVYYLSGGVMLAVSMITLLGIKLPLPHFSRQLSPQKADIGSIFSLGIFSGITSACCAPVLVGILSLTFLSPSFFGGVAIGGMYVLGMVTPLLLISLFLDNKIPKFTLLRKPLATPHLFGHTLLVNLSNLIAWAIFFTTGLLTIILTYTGALTENSMDKFTKVIENAAGTVDKIIPGNVFINLLFFLIVIVLLTYVWKAATKSQKPPE